MYQILTFNIPNWETVITAVSIPSTIAVYGNGYGLTLSDGTTDAGIHRIQTNNAASGALYPITSNNVGHEIGTSVVAGGGTVNHSKVLGVTTDPTKSGIIAKSNSITKTSLSIKFSIKY